MIYYRESMKIRKATKKDVDEIVELTHQLFMSQINNCQVDFNLNKNFKTVQKRCILKDMKNPKNAFFVAVAPRSARRTRQQYSTLREENEKLAGFISGKVEIDSPVYVNRINGRVNGFYVKDTFRSKGVGKKLFAEMKKWFKKKKAKSLRIQVARCNIGAKRAYNSLGFEPADFEQLILKM